MKYGSGRGYGCGTDDMLDHVILKDAVIDQVTVIYESEGFIGYTIACKRKTRKKNKLFQRCMYL